MARGRRGTRGGPLEPRSTPRPRPEAAPAPRRPRPPRRTGPATSRRPIGRWIGGTSRRRPAPAPTGGDNGCAASGAKRRSPARQGGSRRSGRRQPAEPAAGRAASRAAASRQGGEGEPGNRRRRRRGATRQGQDQPGPRGAAEPVEVEGLPRPARRGLRLPAGRRGYLPSKDDVYVSVKQVRQFGLRKGDHVKGASRPALRNEKNPALLRIDQVNGVDPERGPPPPPLRGPHPAVPRREAAPGDRRRPGEHDGADHRPDLAHREGPARPHRVAAQGRQDHDHEADRPVDRDQQPRGHAHRAARRRAARRGHRHAPVAEASARSWPPRSTGPPRSTPRWPSSPSSGPSAWSRTARTS